MRATALKLAIAWAVSMGSTAWAADNLAQCDFNKSNGACAPVVRYDDATSSYTIAATGLCQTVTVLIDGTQYPHKMKDQSVTDSVMRLDKTKAVNVSATTCTSHPTKEEVYDGCIPLWHSGIANRRAQNPCAEGQNCDKAAGLQCASAVIDSINACIGARAVRLKDLGGGKIRAELTGEYSDAP